MKRSIPNYLAALLTAMTCCTASSQELVSVRLSDVIKSQGTGNIDLMKDVTASQLEHYRLNNDGFLVLGDPEAFYDFSAGFEDLALLNAADTSFIDDYTAGCEEAPTVILTNPPAVIDTLAVANWNYFPSSTAFYLVGYEDLYPVNFNDLTVAYRLQHGLNADGDVVAQGLAYLLTQGSAYDHDWHLSIDLPGGCSGAISCSSSPDWCSTYLIDFIVDIPEAGQWAS